MDDFSHLSDAELEAIAGGNSATEASAANDFSHMSDEDLAKIAGVSLDEIKPEEPAKPSFFAGNRGVSNTYMPASTAEDAAKSLGAKATRTLVNSPLWAADLGNLANTGLQKGFEYYRDVSGQPLSLAQEHKLESYQPFMGSDEVGMSPLYEPKTGWGEAAGVLGDVVGFSGAAGLGAKAGRALTKAPPPTSKSEFDALKKEQYKISDEAGGVYKPHIYNKFLDEVESVKPTPIAGEFAEDDLKLIDKMKEFSKWKDKPLTTKEVDRIDRILSDKIDASFVNHKPTNETRLFTQLQDKLREVTESAGEADIVGGVDGINALRNARHYATQGYRMGEIERIFNRAATFDNPDNAIRTGFRQIMDNPRRFNSYTKKEQALIRAAATGSTKLASLRLIGRGLNPLIAAASGAGPLGVAAVQGAGLAARTAAGKVQMARGLKVANEVGRRPLPKPIVRTPAPVAESEPIRMLTEGEGRRPMVSGWNGESRPMTDAEWEAHIAGNKEASDIGLTPDVRAAQEQHVINKMKQERGQSELGNWSIENRHKPIGMQTHEVPATEYSQAQVDKMLRGTAWDKIDAEQKAAISQQVERLWNSGKVSIDDMIQAAKQSADDVTAATGDAPKNTAMRDALLNLGKNQQGNVSSRAAIATGLAGAAGSALSQKLPVVSPQPAAAPKYKTMDELMGSIEELKQKNVPASFQSEEGFRPKVYPDTTGHKTVGIGFNMDSKIARDVWKSAGIDKDFNAVRSGKQQLTEQEAQKLLEKSYNIATDDIKKLVPNVGKLPDKAQEALTQLAFQHGRGGLKEALPGVLAMANMGNMKGAAARLLASNYAKKYKPRAVRLAKMMTG